MKKDVTDIVADIVFFVKINYHTFYLSSKHFDQVQMCVWKTGKG